MLTKLAIWYLRSKGHSLIINVKINGNNIQAKGFNSFIYDNSINDSHYYGKDGTLITFPHKTKFHIKS